MKILDRYLLRELLVTAAMGILVLSGVLVFGNILRKVFDIILNHEIPLRFTVSFAGCLLPFCLAFTIPWGFVTAVLLVFGRISADHELTAMRTSGLSLGRICRPVFFLTGLLCLFSLWLNATLVPRAHHRMRKIMREIATTHPASLVAGDQVTAKFGGQRIYVGGKTGTKLTNISLFRLNKGLQLTQVLSAKTGEISADSHSQKLELKMTGARLEEWPTPFDPSRIRESFRLARGDTAIPLQQLYMDELRRPPLGSMTLTRILRYRDRVAEPAGTVVFEISRRFSMSLATFALTFVALPLAVGAHRREPIIACAFSLLVSFGYFLFISLAETNRYRPEAHPEWLVWIPNLLFVGLGALLWRRAARQ